MAQPNEGTANGRRSPLLSISSTVREPVAQDYITIDEEPYDFVQLDALGLTERTEIAQLVERVVTLWSQSQEGSLNKTEEQELKSRNRKLVRLVLPSLAAATLTKVEKANPRAIEDIVGCFLLSTLDSSHYPLETMRRMGQLRQVLIGASPSPPSSASMEATQAGG